MLWRTQAIGGWHDACRGEFVAVKLGIVTKQRKMSGEGLFMKKTLPQLCRRFNTTKINIGTPGDYPLSTTVWQLRIGRKIKQKVRENSLDVVLVPAQRYMMFNPQNVDAKVVPVLHSTVPVTTYYPFDSETTFLGNLMSRFYMKNVVKCDNVVTVSDSVADNLKRRLGFNGESRTVYAGIDMPEVDSVKEFDVIHVSSLTAAKDRDWLEDALKELHENGFSTVCVVGPDEDRSASKLDLPGVVVTNVESRERMARLYASARFYLHSSRVEGFGRPPLEAQSLGVPVIARKGLDVNHEILGDAWFSVENPGDVVDVVEERDAFRFSGDARGNAGFFVWADAVNGLTDFLTEVSL